MPKVVMLAVSAGTGASGVSCSRYLTYPGSQTQPRMEARPEVEGGAPSVGSRRHSHGLREQIAEHMASLHLAKVHNRPWPHNPLGPHTSCTSSSTCGLLPRARGSMK